MAGDPFSIPTLQQILDEATRAVRNDSNRENVEVTGFGYTVSEERQRFGLNSSLQSVSTKIIEGLDGQPTQITTLTSREGADSHRISASSNGDVRYSVWRGEREVSWLPLNSETAPAYLTDAQAIRNLQLNIASDGEVDRVEQQQIINLVQGAKDAASRQRD